MNPRPIDPTEILAALTLFGPLTAAELLKRLRQLSTESDRSYIRPLTLREALTICIHKGMIRVSIDDDAIRYHRI